MARKPAGQTWESWVDRQIREARRRGEFDDLPGAGRSGRELHGPYRHGWWLRDKLRRESLSYLPPTLQVRRDLEQARERIAEAGTEREVRRIVADINARIREVNRTAVHGPPSTTAPLDPDESVRTWRRRHTRDD